MATSPAEDISNFIYNLLARRTTPAPLFIGLQGPQGCGKTTACAQAVQRLADDHNLRGVTISIDDFYLTHAEQLRVAAQHAGNAYLSQRGYPGTHDIRLGTETLTKLQTINSSTTGVALPRYDKSLHQGEGDRLSASAWPVVRAPLDFVLVEGWCVGFIPLDEAEIDDAGLTVINRLLAPYGQWYAFFGAFVQIRARQITDTVRWRIEAEQKMRSRGKPAMDDERIQSYIERFLPAYRLFLPGLDRNPPVTAPRMVIDILADRSLDACHIML